MAVAAPNPNQPPDWLKAMLENRRKNNEQLQMMMTPILNHIASSNQALQSLLHPGGTPIRSGGSEKGTCLTAIHCFP